MMTRDAHLPGEDAAVLDPHRARDANLRHEQAQPSDAHVVPDLHEVVDPRPRADHRVIDAAAIDRRVRADLHVRLDDAAPDVRNLLVRPVAEHIAESIRPETRAGVHAHTVAQDAPE